MGDNHSLYSDLRSFVNTRVKPVRVPDPSTLFKLLTGLLALGWLIKIRTKIAPPTLKFMHIITHVNKHLSYTAVYKWF